MDIIEYTANRIRMLREKTGMTQEELADKSGVNKTNLGAIERGVQNPTIPTLHKITTALEIPLSNFFEFDGNFVYLADEDILKSITSYLNALEIEEQKEVLNIICSLIKIKKHASEQTKDRNI